MEFRSASVFHAISQNILRVILLAASGVAPPRLALSRTLSGSYYFTSTIILLRYFIFTMTLKLREMI